MSKHHSRTNYLKSIQITGFRVRQIYSNFPIAVKIFQNHVLFHYIESMKFIDYGIGINEPTFIVAEISGNHGGNKEVCFELIRQAKNVGANAVKFQTYTAETITLNTDAIDFLLPKDSPWGKYNSLFDLYSEAFTPWEWQAELFEYARQLELVPFSSPFDLSAVDFLESIECPIYKIASPEINHIPLLERVSKTGKPIIISLGVASKADLDLALETIRDTNQNEVALLHCETSYPAENENANISQIAYLRESYPYLIGYSDHTHGSLTGLAAVSSGAKIVEKHLVLNASKETVDSFFSSTSDAFGEYVKSIREVEKVLGKPLFRDGGTVNTIRNKRSIYPRKEIIKGELLDSTMITVVRPGLGIHPKFINHLIGKRAKRDLHIGERISLSDFEDS